MAEEQRVTEIKRLISEANTLIKGLPSGYKVEVEVHDVAVFSERYTRPHLSVSIFKEA